MSHYRRRKRHNGGSEPLYPLLVERTEREQQQDGFTYEEARWPRLSPSFRAAHNRLRIARGLAPLPPPKVDLYVPPRVPAKLIDPNAPELRAAAMEFLAQPMMRTPGREGFQIRPAIGSNGAAESEFKLIDEPRPPAQADEGFTVNGAPRT